MKIKLFFSLLVLLSYLFYSCSQPENKNKEGIEVKVESNIDEGMADFHFRIDSTEEMIKFNFELNPKRNYKYPIDEKSGDTLLFTSFRFVLYYHDKPLSAAPPSLLEGKRIGVKILRDELGFKTDTFLFRRNGMDVEFPVSYLMFKDIPSGSKREVQLKIIQDGFYSWSYKKVGADSFGVFHQVKTKHDSNHIKLTLKLDIPKIYTGDLICSRIKLDEESEKERRDGTLSEGYPDIFFRIYNQYHDVLYESAIQGETLDWTRGDTSEFSFFSENDTISIDVRDYDNWSSSDRMASWRGPIKMLKDTSMKFEGIDVFQVKLKNIRLRN